MWRLPCEKLLITLKFLLVERSVDAVSYGSHVPVSEIMDKVFSRNDKSHDDIHN
jgi:hypothetical protein